MYVNAEKRAMGSHPIFAPEPYFSTRYLSESAIRLKYYWGFA